MVHDLGGAELIDLPYAGLHRTMGSYILRGQDGAFMLVECGPLALLHQLEAGIRSAGLEPRDLSDILVTHIHLDHAGAAGTLARRYGATVHAHEAGVPHLLDPERLVASSRRTYGDEFDELMGGMEGVPAEQLRTLRDGDTLTLHGRGVVVMHTPGHAGSHVSFLVDGTDLYTGDSAGIRLAGTSFLKPATAPPEIDLDAWAASIRRMLAVQPRRILLTHFGAFDDPAAHFAELRRQHLLWSRTVLAGLRAGEDDAALVRRITELSEAQMETAGLGESDRERYRVSSNHVMTAAGLARYWRKHHPEALAAGGFPLGRPARIAVLVSGRGSNMLALADEFAPGNELGEVALVVSNRRAAPALDAAAERGIRAEHVPWGGREGFERELEVLLAEEHIDLVCLAGFMRILSPEFVGGWAGRMLNIHPSLLPKFPGLNPQQQALDAGESVSGCSVHLVEADVDAGPVLLRREVPVEPGDTAATLAARIMTEEHRAYPLAVRQLLERGTG